MAEKIKANTLEELVEYLYKRFDVSYAKLARIVAKTAKWQKEKMIRDCSVQASYEAEIEKAEERGYNLCKEQMLKSNPVVLSPDAFQAIINDNYNNGKQAMKEQMLKDAVEGEVYPYTGYQRKATAILIDTPKEDIGDKVKIVLVKEDGK